ncbi:hypothetical protein [Streptomyces sp. NPDC057702]|uniref:hypothetical protein n=1 Tax=unclassified Streptomyces TaxID=2593676 RepID=UPI0036C86FCF
MTAAHRTEPAAYGSELAAHGTESVPVADPAAGGATSASRAVARGAPAGPGERLAHGFLPERPPVRAMIGTWVRLDELAAEVALAPTRAAARALVTRAEAAGELATLRARVARLTHRHAEAAAMRVAVLAAACGWAHLDPTGQGPTPPEPGRDVPGPEPTGPDPEPGARVTEGLADLWSALGHRLDQPHFVALPALALHNWATARKPRRHLPIDQLVRAEALVPVVRWAPAGEPLSRLDRLLLATTRLEAHGVWLFRLADALAHTLAAQGPDAPATATALRRLARVLHALRAQLAAEHQAVAAAPVTDQQRAIIAALVHAAPPPRTTPPTVHGHPTDASHSTGPGPDAPHATGPRSATPPRLGPPPSVPRARGSRDESAGRAGPRAARDGGGAVGRGAPHLPTTLEPPVLQAAEAVLGAGAQRAGESGRQSARRYLPAAQRAWLTALERQCAPVRHLAPRGGPVSMAYHEARTSLIALRLGYAHLLHAAQSPPHATAPRQVA